MVVQEFNILVAQVKSVESGSINTKPENPVIAFTIEDTINNKPVKCIVKGDLAITVWNNFMSDGKTKNKILKDQVTGTEIRKEVFVSFKADLREEREKEVVLENPSNFTFNFIYNVD